MPADDAGIERQRETALREMGLLTRPAPPEFEVMCQQARERFHVAASLVKLVRGDKAMDRGEYL
jgi:hypothetical protein